jgi:uncharacterized protein (TIGR03000 family)
MSRQRLWCCLAALQALMLGVRASSAAPVEGRGGGGRGLAVGRGEFRGGFGPGYRGYYGYRGWGWGGVGFGLGLGLGYGLGYPYGYPYYAYPYGLGYGPPIYVDPISGPPNGYPQAVPGAAPSAPPGAPGMPNAGPVRLTPTDVILSVHVPPDAIVLINGAKTTQSGPYREFLSSGLAPGHSYTFTITARWTGPNGQAVELDRRLPVQGGERRTIDFLMLAQPMEEVPPAVGAVH